MVCTLHLEISSHVAVEQVFVFVTEIEKNIEGFDIYYTTFDTATCAVRFYMFCVSHNYITKNYISVVNITTKDILIIKTSFIHFLWLHELAQTIKNLFSVYLK